MLRNYFLFLFIGFCFSTVVVAEDDHSLTLLINQAESLRTGDKKEFSRLLKQLEESAHSLNQEQKLRLDYLKSYDAINNQFDYQRGIKGFEAVLAQTDSIELKVKSLVILANLHNNLRDYNKSLEYLSDAEDVIKNNPSFELEKLIRITSLVIYNNLHKFELTSTLAKTLLKEDLNNRQKCLVRGLMLESDLNLNTYNKDFFDLTINDCRKSGELDTANVINFVFSEYLLRNNDLLNLKSFTRNNLDKEFVRQSNKLNSAFNYIDSELALSDKKYNEAVLFAKDAIAKESLIGAQRWILNSYRVLADSYKELKDYKNAHKYLSLFENKRYEYLDDEYNKLLAFQLAKQNTIEKERQIEALESKNQLLGLEQKLVKEESENNKLLILLLLSILLSLAYWAYRVKRYQVRLKRQSEIDVLTGVCSRHHFYMMCNKTLEYAKNTDKDVSFIMFDMDRFKSVNDDYGHLVGDWVLETAIAAARPHWRQNDIAGRLGGEEFALMLPTCDLTKAMEIAEKCRQAIESVDTSKSKHGNKFDISASFGVTTSKISGYELQDLIGDADKVMYQAKDSGKNRVLQMASQS